MKSKILYEYAKDRTYASLQCYKQVAMLEEAATYFMDSPHPHLWLLLSDNGPQYVNELTATMAKTYHISQRFTPYYSQQANPTEKVNQVIKMMISSYMRHHQNDWVIYMREFSYALNTSRHSATGYTPAYSNLGRELKLPSLLGASKVTLDLDPTLPQEWVNRIYVLQEVHS
jgi:hypothetical protein